LYFLIQCSGGYRGVAMVSAETPSQNFYRSATAVADLGRGFGFT